VSIGFFTAILAFLIHQRNRNAPRYEISHQVATYLFPLQVVEMWLYCDSLDSNILLPGVARGTYLFPSVLPHALGPWKLRPQ
jgi:hypothetical protein